MRITKVIEVLASSSTSFDDAVQNAIKDAGKGIQNIKSIYVKELKAKIGDGKVVSYGVIAKISFDVDIRP